MTKNEKKIRSRLENKILVLNDDITGIKLEISRIENLVIKYANNRMRYSLITKLAAKMLIQQSLLLDKTEALKIKVDILDEFFGIGYDLKNIKKVDK